MYVLKKDCTCKLSACKSACVQMSSVCKLSLEECIVSFRVRVLMCVRVFLSKSVRESACEWLRVYLYERVCVCVK